jgi:poly-gamma-glutamate synthesis protein (capsule biosynthesis protein)
MKLIYILLFVSIGGASIHAQSSPVQQKLQLLFVGDIMGHDSQIASAKVGEEQYDYTPCFQFVEGIIEKADLAIGNLELTLPGEPPYKGYPQFRSPDALASALRQAGFDMLVTANNHSNDAGLDGVVNTIQTLDEMGFYHTGTFQSAEEKEAYYPLIVYKNQFKLAFLNYTYGTNGLKTKPPSIVNLIDEEQIEGDLKTAKALQPDAIIVIMHWGNEYQLIESKEQGDLAAKLFDWGADLIIGAHPHVVQPIRELETGRSGKGPKKGLVAYSLGNFISGQRRENTDGGMMLEIELVKDLSTGETTLSNHNYIPVWRYIRKDRDGKQTFHVLPISSFEEEAVSILGMGQADFDKMMKFAETTRQHLSRFDSQERRVAIGELQVTQTDK